MLEKKIPNNRLFKLIKFFKTAGKLKRVPRAGWVDVGIQKPESVADHTLRTTIICMIYSDFKDVDQLKLLRMALIHDLPEALMGDLTPSQKTLEKQKEEDTIMKQILNYLPKKQSEQYLMVWNEYLEGTTKEAKIVRQLEKLEMALQAKEYEKAKSTKNSLKTFLETADETIIWPEFRKLLSYICRENKR